MHGAMGATLGETATSRNPVDAPRRDR
jgi:hypothetical protein